MSINDASEHKRRRRETFAVFLLSAGFLILTWLEFQLFETSRDLPFVHSIFFFGLVNFNMILFLLLAFLIFRNVVKSFTEKRDGVTGGRLRSKLIAAFVGFSFVPTLLMFLVSVFYINNSFDKWFSEKTVSVLKSALDVTNQYSVSGKNRNYHVANQLATQWDPDWSRRRIEKEVARFRQTWDVDVIEYYPSLFAGRIISVSDQFANTEIPVAPIEFLRKGILQKADASQTFSFANGSLIRVMVPLGAGEGALVVSTFIPLSLLSRIDQIAAAYEEFRSNSLEYPTKTIYLVILVLMTLVILLGATWFGFYLAKQLSIPLMALGEAAEDVAAGRFRRVDMESGSKEVNSLIQSFNLMTDALEASEREIKSVNNDLRVTLDQLDQHTKYIEVVLSNVSTGVITIDQRGVITTVNRHAETLLGIHTGDFVGERAQDVLRPEDYHVFDELLTLMNKHGASAIQKEVQIQIRGRQIPLQVSISLLTNENNEPLGKIFVFDDLSPVVKAQRVAAWREVARRIAHEIKNPLTPIKLSAQRLRRKFGDQIADESFDACIRMIIEQTDDLKNLVNEFSQFARLPSATPINSDLKRVAKEALILFQEAHPDIQFSTDIDASLPEFMFDPDQIRRVLTNLLDNAVGAVKDREDPQVGIQLYFDGELSLATVHVVDNGPGIPDDLRDRIFEPYVTTKDHGTGLGLAMVKRTIEDHNGFVRALADEGGGTRLVIELPVIQMSSQDTIIKKTEPKEPQA